MGRRKDAYLYQSERVVLKDIGLHFTAGFGAKKESNAEINCSLLVRVIVLISLRESSEVRFENVFL